MLDGITKLFEVDDCKISQLTADTSGSLTYGSATDVPGIRDIKLDPTFIEKELRGDNAVLDTYSKLDKVGFSVEHAKVSLPILAILTGGSISDLGTTPNQIKTLSWENDDLPNFFKLEAQTVYTDFGDFHLIFWKVKMNKLSVEMKGEDYAVVSFSGTGIGTTYNKKVVDFVINETLTNISTGAADTTPPTCSSSVPADTDTGVTLSATITFNMSESLQSITAGNVTVIKASDGSVVAGTAALTNAGASTTIIFTPTSPLSATTDYIAILSGVRDLAGNMIASPVVVNFTTLTP